MIPKAKNKKPQIPTEFDLEGYAKSEGVDFKALQEYVQSQKQTKVPTMPKPTPLEVEEGRVDMKKIQQDIEDEELEMEEVEDFGAPIVGLEDEELEIEDDKKEVDTTEETQMQDWETITSNSGLNWQTINYNNSDSASFTTTFTGPSGKDYDMDLNITKDKINLTIFDLDDSADVPVIFDKDFTMEELKNVGYDIDTLIDDNAGEFLK